MPDFFRISLVGVAKATLVFRTFPFQSKSCLTALGLVLWAGMTPTQAQPLQYPDTRKVDQVDTYFNQVVEDPYRWLEDDRSEETADWVRRQNEVTFGYLKQITYRDKIRKRLESLWNYEKYSAPFQEGEYTYYYKNNGLQNQSVLYRESNAQPGLAEVFLDPNQFSKDGTSSLAGIQFSEDGSHCAFQISEGGSDWRKVVVLHTKTRKQVGDTLVDVKFSSLAWKGREGFFYSSYDKPLQGSALSGKTQFHKLYYHRLDQAQKSDELIFGGEAKPYRYVGAVVSEDGRYLFISAAQATYGNELYFKDLRAKNAPILPIIQGLENETDVVHVEGDSVYLLTNLKAPNRRLVWTSLKSPDSRQWQDVISETEFPLSVSAVGGYFFASYLQDAVSKIVQYNQKGTMVRDIKLPGLGTASGFGGKRNEKICYYSFASYTSPPVIYRLELSEGTSTVYKQSKVDFETDQYVSTQVFYESKDGTKVPMILTHRKDVVPNGENPVLLYGYGGFNISLSPSFSVSNLFFMEQGGIYAVANLRGGGEYGDRWHDAGTKMQKQNVFDDFISAAEWLINNGYTQSGRLAIAGGSNGGLLVGACMTQRPDLFKVCFPAVGVLDMLRYHTFTAGAGWAYDYGRSDDSEEMFRYLRGYSPVHNVKAKTSYPATMVTTADHDDRVVPAHSYKFIAELQSKQSGPSPVLIRIDVKAGHGAGKPTSMILDEAADKWSFMFYNIEFEPPFSR